MRRIVLLSALLSSTLANAQPLVPTWAENVACVLYTNCTSCHHQGGIGPFSLVTYADANSAAFSVLDAISNDRMPPWPPNSDYRQLAHERYLTPQEKAIITDWVNGGRPEGNVANAPSAPVYLNPEEITTPDLTVTIPEFTINTVGNDVYRCFAISTSLTEDVYITDLEVVPGNREAVHHVLVYADETSVPLDNDAADPLPGYVGFGGTGSNNSSLIGGWVPGSGAKHYPSGMGVKLPAGATIVMQIHYPATANGQLDQTKVNIKYTSGGFVRELFIAPPLSHASLNEGILFIPANEQRTFTCDYTIPGNYDITILDVAPHMHLIGKSIKAWATTPTGQVNLIDVPKWDFHWQGFYDFRQPIMLPGGSVLHSEAVYDNTTANLNNPNNPPQFVVAGEATTNEMMLIYFTYTLHFPGDENIVIDTSTVKQTYNDCDFGTNVSVSEVGQAEQSGPFPNPTNGVVTLNMPVGQAYSTEILSMDGRVVRKSSVSTDQVKIDLSGLPKGAYMIKVSGGSGIAQYRVILQ